MSSIDDIFIINTVKPIVYHVNKNATTSVEFNDEHILPENIVYKIKQDMERDTANRMPLSVVIYYTRELFTNPINQCFRKETLQSPTTDVHVAEDEWKPNIDTVLYPDLISHIVLHFKRYLDVKILGASKSSKSATKEYIKDTLIPLLDFLAHKKYSKENKPLKDMMESIQLSIYTYSKVIYRIQKIKSKEAEVRKTAAIRQYMRELKEARKKHRDAIK
jgi:hypothetical protein